MTPESPIRRINLFGGPGAGKSTNAAYVFYKMKMLGFNVEIVTEIAKRYAVQNIPIEGDIQLECAQRQREDEEFWLRNGVEYIVTDSPLLLQYMYAMERGEVEMAKDVLLPAALECEKNYPSLNIFLERDGVPYQSIGRFQKDIQEARFIDAVMKNTIFRRLQVPYHTVNSIDRKKLLQTVLHNINEPTLETNPQAEGLSPPVSLFSRIAGWFR